MVRFKPSVRWLIVVTLLVSGLACSLGATPTPVPPETLLLGEWQGIYDGDPLTFVFNAGGVLLLRVYDREIATSYTVDFSHTPAYLDITIEGERVETIVEFVDENTLRLENILPGDPRPTQFTNSVETVTLTRQ